MRASEASGLLSPDRGFTSFWGNHAKDIFTMSFKTALRNGDEDDDDVDDDDARKSRLAFTVMI